MSFDPNQGPPNRPRSTPIPDDGSGLSLPPPTAAQFLREAGTDTMAPPQMTPPSGFQQPGFQSGFQQPGFQSGFQQGVPSQNLPYVPTDQTQWNGGTFNAGGVPFVTSGNNGLRGFRIGITLFIVITTLAVVGFAIWKTNSAINKATSSNDNVPTVSIPDFTVPTFSVPDISIPQVNVPDISIPLVTVPNIVLPTVPGEVPPASVDPTATTVAVAPPVTALPGGVNSLFEGQAARAIVDQFEANFAGEPTQFTQLIFFTDYAIATAQDAANPAGLTGALWRGGALTPATVTSDGVTDINTQLFTEADVNWDAIASLVPAAPGLLGIADGSVSHIIVQKSPFDPAMPITFAVYVTGASQSGYLEAAADGTVIATHV